MALGHHMRVLELDERPDFAALYREIGPQLWRAILVYTGGRRDLADDAVGEAFVRAMESRTTIRSPVPRRRRTGWSGRES
jgi:DNA-directed RNA polymerase specialized sigma24 family protein